MQQSTNPLEGFLTNLATELTVKLVELAAGRLKQAALGDAEQQALRRVYRQAFEDMLQAAASEISDGEQYLLADIMKAFVESDNVAQRLVDLAIDEQALPLSELRREFELLGFDASTLPVDFDTLFTALVKALEDAIRVEASRDSLKDRLIVRSLSEALDRILQTRQDIQKVKQEILKGQEELRRLIFKQGVQVADLTDLQEAGIVKDISTIQKVQQDILKGQEELRQLLTKRDINIGDLTNVQNVGIGENITINKISNEIGLPYEQVLELIRALNPAAYEELRRDTPVLISDTARPLPEPLQAVKDVVLAEEAVLVLNDKQAKQIDATTPQNLTEYRLGRIVEWAHPDYQLNRCFVQLTLLVKGDEGWIEDPAQSHPFQDIREVLAGYGDKYPAFVVLGEPGCGKSTLLRRLQMDLSIDDLRQHDEKRFTYLISLNTYRTKMGQDGKQKPSPREWLKENWLKTYPAPLPSLSTLLAEGRLFLMLDAINEMPHSSTSDYEERVGVWREFLQEAVKTGNRLLFSCRDLNYSASLSQENKPVPHIVIQPLTPEQVHDFLDTNIPEQADSIWKVLDPAHDPRPVGARQIDLFRIPFFLKLLIDQIRFEGLLPEHIGRAGLFTGFVRRTLTREKRRGNPLLSPNTLLTRFDDSKLAKAEWQDAYDLPTDGLLIPKFESMAYEMQERRGGPDKGQVSIPLSQARQLLSSDRADDILSSGDSLNVLDVDERKAEVKYFHQLLQEFFAARRLAKNPNPDLVRVEWRADQVKPSLQETLKTLADSDPLPPLPASGWEETTVLAAAMTDNPPAFIRDVMAANLPLAARCLANPEVKPDEVLKRAIQEALITRTQDKQADLRARITADEALGLLGDPRFEHKTGPHGGYLLPPLVSIPAGEYPIGDDDAPYDDEKPAHTVKLAAFQIGMFPVTNAEYALFMAAGGYEDECWWDTAAAKAWLKGEGDSEGQKADWRERRKSMQQNLDWIRSEVGTRFTSEEVKNYEAIAGMSDEEFEAQLNDAIPSGKIYRRPAYWDDSRFNNPAQPVVGVTWFEARAYCNWLTDQVSGSLLPEEEGLGMRVFRLPTEVEREAAARGAKGRRYAYGPEHDPALCNTFETHIRRTTPVGVFPGGQTPEGCVDLTGNVWNWTSTRYDQNRFPYRYQGDDGREDPEAEGYRVLRGGSWNDLQYFAHCSYRYGSYPGFRYYGFGFRVCVCRPPSL